MAGRALQLVAKEISRLRAEEEAEDSWFMLPDENEDSTNWLDFKVSIAGPDTYNAASVPGAGGAARPSPYSGGTFRVRLKLGDSYPSAAPEVYFATKCWHPNVEWATGKVCIDDVLGGAEWKPEVGIRGVLGEMRRMLAEKAGGTVNAEAAKEAAEDMDAFDRHARELTAKYAVE